MTPTANSNSIMPLRTRCPARSQRGVTLVEAMVTLAITVIVLRIGLPSFNGVVNSSRLTSASNDLSAGLQTARAEAIRRNLNVILCASSDQVQCTTSGAWSGWLVFVDTNGNGALDAGEPVLKTSAMDPGLTLVPSAAISSRQHRVQFSPNGRAVAGNETATLNATVMVCVPATDPALNVRDVSIAFGSRVGIQSRNTGGACDTAPSDS